MSATTGTPPAVVKVQTDAALKAYDVALRRWRATKREAWARPELDHLHNLAQLHLDYAGLRLEETLAGIAREAAA
jgi:hypothetical protein